MKPVCVSYSKRSCLFFVRQLLFMRFSPISGRLLYRFRYSPRFTCCSFWSSWSAYPSAPVLAATSSASTPLNPPLPPVFAPRIWAARATSPCCLRRSAWNFCLCPDRNAHLWCADSDRGEHPDQGTPVNRHFPSCGTAAFHLTQDPHRPFLLPVDAGFVFLYESKFFTF